MSQLFNIENDRIVIGTLALTNLQGDVTHSGNLTVQGEIQVSSSITVDTLIVKHLVTANESSSEIGRFVASSEAELVGKGLHFDADGPKGTFIFRDDQRFWSNLNIDLEFGKSYKIGNIEVLSETALGASVTKSNLRQVGALSGLIVNGHTNIGHFAFFNPEDGRLGLNTEQPNGALSIIENDVELIVGATNTATAIIGSYSNHDVAIVSDNIPRLTVKKNGEVHVGAEGLSNTVLKVFGTIEASSVVTDNRIDRASSLEFIANRNSTIYGLGLTWKDVGTKQFIMMSDPDRLWSSESIEVAEGKGFFVDGSLAISKTALGDHVTESNLNKVGTLRELLVQGDTVMYSGLTVKDVSASSITFNNGSNSIDISPSGFNTNGNISFSIQSVEEIYIDNREIVLGNKQNTARPVKIFGALSVGVNNPDPDLSLAVSGNMSFGGRKFFNGLEVPSSGTYSVGDICWNTAPTPDGYVGWICTVAGSPGTWFPFGAIGRQ